LLADEPGKTELLAGGTDLIGLMKKMVVTPDRVVNIMEVSSMQQIEPLSDGGLSIGATVTLDDLLASPYIEDFPAVAQAIHGINSMQLQAQGTLGGEICQRARCWYFRNGHGLLANGGRISAGGDNRHHAILGNSGPAKFVNGSRLAPALIVLGAKARVLGADGESEKWIAVEDFFRTPRHEGQRETVLEPNELLTHVVLPPAKKLGNATYEVRQGVGPEYPLAAAAASLRIDLGVVREAKIALGQVAPIPWVSQDAANQLLGLQINDAVADAAGEAAIATATPLSDNQYKVDLAKVAVKRAILRAAGLETGGF
jgi:xanthine dehydrogenase YagS FAD-binding subunit